MKNEEVVTEVIRDWPSNGMTTELFYLRDKQSQANNTQFRIRLNGRFTSMIMLEESQVVHLKNALQSFRKRCLEREAV